MTEERIQESRRRLLKIIAATSGAVAASTVLPGTWLKPVVEMGVLPAHAQLSDRAVNIYGLVVECLDCEEVGPSGDAGASLPTTWLNGWFDWEALCDLSNADSYLTVVSQQCGTIFDKRKLGSGWWANAKKKSKDQKGKVFYGSAGFCSSDYCWINSDTIRAWVDSCGETSSYDEVAIRRMFNGTY